VGIANSSPKGHFAGYFVSSPSKKLKTINKMVCPDLEHYDYYIHLYLPQIQILHIKQYMALYNQQQYVNPFLQI
jgi:hypothetical protein